MNTNKADDKVFSLYSTTRTKLRDTYNAFILHAARGVAVLAVCAVSTLLIIINLNVQRWLEAANLTGGANLQAINTFLGTSIVALSYLTLVKILNVRLPARHEGKEGNSCLEDACGE